MNAHAIRNNAKNEEIDYVLLKSFLSRYANPRDKISRLLKTGDLIRVKKGLYVIGRSIARAPWSLETLAKVFTPLSSEMPIVHPKNEEGTIAPVTSSAENPLETHSPFFGNHYVHTNRDLETIQRTLMTASAAVQIVKNTLPASS